MSDPKQTLTPSEVGSAGLADWRQLLDCLRARFRTGNFESGLQLVNRIGAAAEAADHHPDIVLTCPEVIVSLSSHDVRGITSRDIDLAREISGFAAELGASADVRGLVQVELGLDTTHGDRHEPVYAALFAGIAEDGREGKPADPGGQAPPVWWQEPEESGEADEHALPAQAFEQRWHLDVWVPIDDAERRLQAVLDAGGTLVSDKAAPSYWVIEDADGNRSCICTVADRGE